MLAGGLGPEIQLITLRLLYAKEIYTHICYECLRDMNLKMESEPSDELKKAIEGMGAVCKSCYIENLKREGTKEPLAKPNIDLLSNEEKEIVIENVRSETKERAEALLFDMIDANEIEHHSMLSQIKDSFDIKYLLNF